MGVQRISGQLIFGLVVVGVGILLLLGSLDVIETGDVFVWFPSLFILLGIFLIVKNRFRHVVGPILMIVVAAIIQVMVLDILDILTYWPAILIAVGLVIFIKSFGARRRRENGESLDADQGWIDSVSVLGSATERVVAREFRGGQASVVMGEIRLDLRESAVVEKPATLEVTVVMGEVKLRVPSHWNVRVDNVTIMGESKDERLRPDPENAQTDLTIGGTVVMGSLKIED